MSEVKRKCQACMQLVVPASDYDALKAERDELSSDLQNYGAHHIDCTIWTATYDERCSCGLNAALARIAAKE